MLVLFAIEACHERCLEDVVELEVLIINPLFAKKEEMPRDFQSNWILGVPIPYLLKSCSDTSAFEWFMRSQRYSI